jgi:hypothetical protein
MIRKTTELLMLALLCYFVIAMFMNAELFNHYGQMRYAILIAQTYFGIILCLIWFGHERGGK